MRLQSDCCIAEPMERLLRFCQAEYRYYDGIRSDEPNRIEPLDLLATISVSAFFAVNATRVREIHQGLAAACNSLLAEIPEDADLLSFDPSLETVRDLLHLAIQVPRVLIPVATKVLHRKRRALIPMLDNVVLAHYLGTSPDHLPAATQDKRRAAGIAVEVLQSVRDDLRIGQSELDSLRQSLAVNGYTLTTIRILEFLIWSEVEPYGYYR